MSYKREITMLTIILLILVGLNAYLISKAGTYNCEKCTVSYDNKGFLGELRGKIGPFIIKDLYEELINKGTCNVQYDRTQGYTYHG